MEAFRVSLMGSYGFNTDEKFFLDIIDAESYFYSLLKRESKHMATKEDLDGSRPLKIRVDKINNRLMTAEINVWEKCSFAEEVEWDIETLLCQIQVIEIKNNHRRSKETRLENIHKQGDNYS
ncbi:hypothetical protein [Bacillus atrophaeus]|uniref:hypothetical protein n=1 Tax=Bacillus atrophaeus TaxID=1452 RepID=UPI002282C3C2|nr:hypothetical protein [Bacillus atrophaeus]MCY8466443.1 hypothetical protein [Bacillus atrophaeus]MCY8478902.1 hypothetical protein [Bacillus atrophaeus]